MSLGLHCSLVNKRNQALESFVKYRVQDFHTSYSTVTCIYIFTWAVSGKCSWGTCRPDGSGDFGELKSTACIFGVGSLHVISREAAALKPEAVVSYVQEEDRRRKPGEPPKQHFISRNT